jgi:hypothetical protein
LVFGIHPATLTFSFLNGSLYSIGLLFPCAHERVLPEFMDVRASLLERYGRSSFEGSAGTLLNTRVDSSEWWLANIEVALTVNWTRIPTPADHAPLISLFLTDPDLNKRVKAIKASRGLLVK